MEEMPGLMGFNVTLPHKESILGHLDSLDENAAAIGAVNTVKREHDGTWRGYNTDWTGFLTGLTGIGEESFRQSGKALILGTGGSSRAVAFALSRLGMQVLKAGRSGKAPGAVSYAELEGRLAEFSLIVNCTPLGMYPRVEGLPDLPYSELRSGQILYDLVYNPAETRFMQEGLKQGCRVLNGLPMLYAQADAAWAIWSS
jgi:shikimate dehydrogenase